MRLRPLARSIIVAGMLLVAACGRGDGSSDASDDARSDDPTTTEAAGETVPVLRPASGDLGARAVVAGVVTVPGGFLAIGERFADDGGGGDLETVTTFWRSAEGRSWTMADADPAVWGDWTADRVAQGPSGIVVLASGANGRALAASVDGETWTVTPVTADIVGLPAGAFPGAFPVNDVVAYDGGFLALGQLVGTGTVPTEPAPLLLSSPDGVNWTKAAGPPLASAPILPEYFAGAAELDGDLFAFVTSAQGFDVNVWRSTDTVTWERLGGPELFPGADHVVVGAATAFDGRLVAAGHDHTSGAAVVWTSADGRTWATASGDGLAGDGRFAPELLLTGPDGLLMVGTREPASDGAMAATVWASADGQDWLRQPDDSPVVGRDDLYGVARSDAAVAVVGVHYPGQVDLATVEFAAWWIEEVSPEG
jgi:hypothetical protein